jgi:hypothetical protein
MKQLLSGIISKELAYHMREGKGVDENIFRPGSTKFFDLFREARDLYDMGLYKLNENEEYYIAETDIGEWGEYEGNIVPLDFPLNEEDHDELMSGSVLDEAEYKGRKVTLNKPKRGGNKSKFYVYVMNPKTKKVKKVTFGAKGMTTGLNNPKRVKSFVARHRCKTHANDKTKAAYWSCRLPRYFGNSGKKWW